MIEIPSTILLAINQNVNNNEHHGCPFTVIKSENVKFDWAVDGHIIIAENFKLDQGLKLDHGAVYGSVIQYIKPTRFAEKFFNLENTSW